MKILKRIINFIFGRSPCESCINRLSVSNTSICYECNDEYDKYEEEDYFIERDKDD